MTIPKDKRYPANAGQCDNCGGYGCKICHEKGWLAAGHPKIRKCESCGNVLAPDHIAVYCSNECAAADA